MKKILIVSHALEIGGAERSLIGLLDAIDKKEYQVDLFLLRMKENCFRLFLKVFIYYQRYHHIQYLHVRWYRL
mgnify:CR=1 FL=1